MDLEFYPPESYSASPRGGNDPRNQSAVPLSSDPHPGPRASLYVSEIREKEKGRKKKNGSNGQVECDRRANVIGTCEMNEPARETNSERFV